MKYIKEYLEQKLKIKPLGVVTTEVYYDKSVGYTGESILIDGMYTGIVVYYILYINWLENEIH